MIPACIALAAVVLVVGLAVTLLVAALDRAKRQLATTEQRVAETTAALDRQRGLLSSTEARLAETSASLAEMNAKYNEAHRDRQLLLAEAGAHRGGRDGRDDPGAHRRRAARDRSEARGGQGEVVEDKGAVTGLFEAMQPWA